MNTTRAAAETADTRKFPLVSNLKRGRNSSFSSRAISRAMQRMPSAWFGTPSPGKRGPGCVKIFPIMPNAAVTSPARKNIQAKRTTANVTGHPIRRDANPGPADFAADLLDFMFERYRRGGENVIMHDALAVAAALYPECMKYTDYYVDVETTGTYTRGHTAADFRGRLGKAPNMACAMEIDVPKFRNWLVERISACRWDEKH